MGNMGAAGE